MGAGSGLQCSAQNSSGIKCLGHGGQDPTWTAGPDSPRPVQEVLEEWLNCQRAWLYLEPIFSSEDINRQLPVESKRYQTMERIWRKIMKNAYENREASSHGDGGRAAGALKRFLGSTLPEQERLEDKSKALVLAVVPLRGLPSLETCLRNTAVDGSSSWRFAVPISIFKGPDKSCSKSNSLALVNCSLFVFNIHLLIWLHWILVAPQHVGS